MTNNSDPRELACQSWFGYGQWTAPYWFIGMEPGGEDDLAWYETWLRLGGNELCDCREHHLGTGYVKWHSGNRPPTQRTWLRLIQLLFGYKGKQSGNLAAVSVYQRDEWGLSNGETALPEVSAIRARSRATVVKRNAFRDHRIETLRRRLEHYQPTFAVFYGLEYAAIYERIANTKFDADGYAWFGPTLCILLRHPAARNNPIEMKSGNWWVEKGAEMRRRIAPREEVGRAQAPDIADRSQDRRMLKERSEQSSVLRKNSVGHKVQPAKADVIRVLVAENPKRGKSRARFACYADHLTVANYLSTVRDRLGEAEARKYKQDIQWDVSRAFIRIERSGKPLDISISCSLQRP